MLATLLVAGVVTVGIARWQAHASTEERLREQAESLAAGATVSVSDDAGPLVEQATRRVLSALRAALRVDGIEIVLIGPAGRVRGTLPDGVVRDDLDIATLRAGTTTSGSHGGLVWAAAPQRVNNSTAVAVVTARPAPNLGEAVPWFVGAGAATLALGAGVALLLGRRLARPVRAAGTAARRIAAGDLSARVAEPGSGDEVDELARSINAMATELERARTLDQQFLLSIGHDLRTPLTSIRGYAEAISDGAAADPATAAAVISAEAARLERLLGDLLTLARLDGRAFTMHPQVIDLAGPVGEAIRAFAPTAAAAGLAVTERGAGEPALVVADPARVGQLLGNLLANAGHFARSAILVTVDADGAGGWLVRVDDDGPGIPAGERERVFDRLYSTRLAPARAEAGTGLGLAIVRQLAAAMGATVRAEESPAGGARVEVRFPAAS